MVIFYIKNYIRIYINDKSILSTDFKPSIIVSNSLTELVDSEILIYNLEQCIIYIEILINNMQQCIIYRNANIYKNYVVVYIY